MKFEDELITRLREARSIVFFTGAGASTESGVPTFRDSKNSFWVDFDVETYATTSGFSANPARVWQWYAERCQQLQTLAPNMAHQVMAAWQDKIPSVSVITQNIDGLHQRAGSKEVIELHGNIATYKCFDHDHPAEYEVRSSDELPPHCKLCESLLRPDVVWFGEKLPVISYEQAEQVSFNTEVFISIGSSLEVYPAASLPLSASRYGAYLIQINPKVTLIDKYADCNLHGKAGEIMPLLWQAVWREQLPQS